MPARSLAPSRWMLRLALFTGMFAALGGACGGSDASSSGSSSSGTQDSCPSPGHCIYDAGGCGFASSCSPIDCVCGSNLQVEVDNACASDGSCVSSDVACAEACAYFSGGSVGATSTSGVGPSGVGPSGVGPSGSGGAFATSNGTSGAGGFSTSNDTGSGGFTVTATTSGEGGGSSCAQDGFICGQDSDCCSGHCGDESCQDDCSMREDPCELNMATCCPGFTCIEINPTNWQCQMDGCAPQGSPCSTDDDCCNGFFCISDECY